MKPLEFQRSLCRSLCPYGWLLCFPDFTNCLLGNQSILLCLAISTLCWQKLIQRVLFITICWNFKGLFVIYFNGTKSTFTMIHWSFKGLFVIYFNGTKSTFIMIHWSFKGPFVIYFNGTKSILPWYTGTLKVSLLFNKKKK